MGKNDRCTQARCSNSCADKTPYDKCVDTVTKDTASCGKYDVRAACPALYVLATTSCKDVDAVVDVLCGGASPAQPDAGTSSLERSVGVAPDGLGDSSPERP